MAVIVMDNSRNCTDGKDGDDTKRSVQMQVTALMGDGKRKISKAERLGRQSVIFYLPQYMCYNILTSVFSLALSSKSF